MGVDGDENTLWLLVACLIIALSETNVDIHHKCIIRLLSNLN